MCQKLVRKEPLKIDKNFFHYKNFFEFFSVFVINRAPNELFTSPKFKEQSEALDALLNDTQLDYKCTLL